MGAAAGRGDMFARRTGEYVPHYWHLLGKSALGTDFSETPGLRSVEMMRSFEEAEDWEKLEVWMVVVWQSLPQSTPAPTMEDVERVTRKLLLQRPSALQRFKTYANGAHSTLRTRPNSSRYATRRKRTTAFGVSATPVSFRLLRPILICSDATLLFAFSQLIHAQPLVPLPFAGDDTF
jgi:hypothetical protein